MLICELKNMKTLDPDALPAKEEQEHLAKIKGNRHVLTTITAAIALTRERNIAGYDFAKGALDKILQKRAPIWAPLLDKLRDYVNSGPRPEASPEALAAAAPAADGVVAAVKAIGAAEDAKLLAAAGA